MASSENVDHLTDDFWVVAVLNNPSRFKRRVQLFNEFIGRMKAYGVNLCVVEVAYGQLNFETADLDVPVKINLRSTTVLWQKENMINIGINRLPPSWKYVAWIDSDIDFVNKNWVADTIHALQHHAVVQLFTDSIDLGPDGEIMNTAKSFMYCYKSGMKRSRRRNLYNGYAGYASGSSRGLLWHPGYAWAATRHAIETVGQLFEYAILGAGDCHMACALIGRYKLSFQDTLTDDYTEQLHNWQRRALKLHKNVGCIDGTIYHYWHGKKSDRRYGDRWKILVNHKYEPTNDVYHDWQGLLVFHAKNHKLRDDIRHYFNSRNEDLIDL